LSKEVLAKMGQSDFSGFSKKMCLFSIRLTRKGLGLTSKQAFFPKILKNQIWPISASTSKEGV